MTALLPCVRTAPPFPERTGPRELRAARAFSRVPGHGAAPGNRDRGQTRAAVTHARPRTSLTRLTCRLCPPAPPPKSDCGRIKEAARAGFVPRRASDDLPEPQGQTAGSKFPPVRPRLPGPAGRRAGAAAQGRLCPPRSTFSHALVPGTLAAVACGLGQQEEGGIVAGAGPGPPLHGGSEATPRPCGLFCLKTGCCEPDPHIIQFEAAQILSCFIVLDSECCTWSEINTMRNRAISPCVSPVPFPSFSCLLLLFLCKAK